MKKTVLLYTENYLKGGGNRYVVDIINAIPLDYEIILSSNPNGLFSHDFERINRTYLYIPIEIQHAHTYTFKDNSVIKRVKHYATKTLRIFKDKYYNKKLFDQLLSKHNPQTVISANGGYPAALSCLQLIEVAAKRGINTILTVVSMPQSQKTPVNFLIEKVFYAFFLKKVDFLIVNAQTIKNAFVGTRSISPDKIIVIHNCVDIHPILEKENKDYLTIGYIGRIEEEKGIFFLIEAFNQLLKHTNKVKLLLVGDGNIQKAQEKILEYGIEDKVTLTGFYEGKIENILDEMDIFAFPSLWEGFPYSILEAMSVGKIVVSTNVGGIPEAIENGINGFLVSPANTNQLYNTLKMIVLNFQNYANVGRKAQETILQRYSSDIFKNKIIYNILNNEK